LHYSFAKDHLLGIAAPAAAQPVVTQPATALPPTFSRLNAKFDVNIKKFKMPTTPMMPELSPLWVDALSHVSVDWRRIWDHTRRPNMKGYALPDPFIFVGEGVGEVRALKNLICWLFIRTSWLARTTTNDKDNIVLMPTPQQWRDYLVKVAASTGLEAARGPRANSSRRNELATTGFDRFHEAMGFNGSPRDVYWRGSIVGRAVDFIEGRLSISVDTMREVVWDLFEHNWRMELLSLDRILRPRSAMTAAQRTEREALVSDVVPRGMFVLQSPSTRDEGLAVREWKDRAEYVETFRQLLSTWLVPGAEVLEQMSAGRLQGTSFVTDQATLESVERRAYHFYCQTFFEYTGRAPTIPFPFPCTM